jgi:hypothetical protein
VRVRARACVCVCVCVFLNKLLCKIFQALFNSNVSIKMTVFWDVALCNLVEVY